LKICKPLTPNYTVSFGVSPNPNLKPKKTFFGLNFVVSQANLPVNEMNPFVMQQNVFKCIHGSAEATYNLEELLMLTKPHNMKLFVADIP
jgi:hypothetical protein